MLPVDKGLNLEKHADEIGPAHVCSKHNRVICRYMCAFAVMEIILAGSVLRNYWRRASTAGFPTNDYALAGAVASKYS